MTPLHEIPVFLLDVETTGIDHRSHRLCEIAVVQWLPREHQEYNQRISWSTLVNPGRSIPLAASAVHGLREQDLEHAPSVQEALELFDQVVPADALVLAHNLRFDSSFVPLGARARACTLKIARRAWPQAPSHANAKLATWLGINLSGKRLHRALADVAVTEEIFTQALDVLAERHGKFPTVEDLTGFEDNESSSRAFRTSRSALFRTRQKL